MVGKHPRALALEAPRKRRAQFVGGQGIEARHPGGEVDQPRLIRLPHEIDEPPGRAESLWLARHDSRTRSRKNCSQMKNIPRQE